VQKENPIEVWGSGEQVRDWIHISDIVEGVLSTMHVLPPGGVMNLGSGVGTSFRDLIGNELQRIEDTHDMETGYLPVKSACNRRSDERIKIAKPEGWTRFASDAR
jgi:nucleoside-diphosphate-sugar epimerase